jgi:tRNA (cmo5U34)-methyltransferase
LVDLSEKMLDIARLRFEGLPNVSIEQADFTTFEMEISSYDAIVSSLAIHHLTNDNKRLLYNRIYQALKPSGLFVNAEQILADNDFMQSLYHSQWCNKIEHSTLSRQEISASYERIKLDKRATIAAQLNWLKDAGFSQTDCLYKYYYFAVLWAMK